MIPKGLSKQHVLAAIEEILRKGVPPGRRSTKYCLLYQGRYLPPKYVVSLASKQLMGSELSYWVFNGGAETNKVLAGLGFEVTPCHCGGLVSGSAKAGGVHPAPTGPLVVPTTPGLLMPGTPGLPVETDPGSSAEDPLLLP